MELSKVNPGHPYEPRHIGIQLAASGDEILWLSDRGSVSILNRERVMSRHSKGDTNTTIH